MRTSLGGLMLASGRNGSKWNPAFPNIVIVTLSSGAFAGS